MLFSGFSAAWVVAAAALLNSDNAVLSEAREVSRSLWNDWRAASAITVLGVVPDGPLCPYCANAPCPVCHGTHRAYDEACGKEGEIAEKPERSSEMMAGVLKNAVAAIVKAVNQLKTAAKEAYLNRLSAVPQNPSSRPDDVEAESRMGCHFLPGCDFGWTAEPDTAGANPGDSTATIRPRPPEPPADADAPPPVPVAPAVASQVETAADDERFLPPDPKRSIRPVLFGAAKLLEQVAEAANAASERLYSIAGDETPDDAD